MFSGFSFNVLTHCRLTVTVAGAAVTSAVMSEMEMEGNTLVDHAVLVVPGGGIIMVMKMAQPIPAAQRRTLATTHDPLGNFGFITLFQPSPVISEPLDDSIEVGLAFQPGALVDGTYEVDVITGIVRV